MASPSYFVTIRSPNPLEVTLSHGAPPAAAAAPGLPGALPLPAGIPAPQRAGCGSLALKGIKMGLGLGWAAGRFGVRVGVAAARMGVGAVRNNAETIKSVAKTTLKGLGILSTALAVIEVLAKPGAVVNPLILGSLAVGSIGAAAIYSPTVRNGLSKAASAGVAGVKGAVKGAVVATKAIGSGLASVGGAICSPTVMWGIGSGAGLFGSTIRKMAGAGYATSNFLWNHASKIGSGIAFVASPVVNTISAIGTTSTAVVSGVVRAGTNVVAEAGKVVATAVDAVGNIAPVATGAAVLGGAYYYGSQYLMGQ